MALEYEFLGALGRAPDVDSVIAMEDADDKIWKIKANSTTDNLEVIKNGAVVGTLGASSYGTVTQQTNRATGVTLSTMSGAITTNNASLAAEASAVFVVTNTLVKATDVVVVCIRSGAVGLNTRATVTVVADGSFQITVVNGNAAAGAAETGAIIINFQVLRQPTAAITQ